MASNIFRKNYGTCPCSSDSVIAPRLILRIIVVVLILLSLSYTQIWLDRMPKRVCIIYSFNFQKRMICQNGIWRSAITNDARSTNESIMNCTKKRVEFGLTPTIKWTVKGFGCCPVFTLLVVRLTMASSMANSTLFWTSKATQLAYHVRAQTTKLHCTCVT